MWTSLTNLALGLSCTSQILSVTSSRIISRQQQCESAAPNDAAYAACAMQASFGGSAVVPELLTDFSPKAALSVKYGNVVLGGAQQLSPSRVFFQPSLSMTFISNNSQAFQKQYAVMGISFQPTPKTVKLFWLQSSLKVDPNTGAMSSASAPIVNYISPNPASGTGSHEYIFFIFQDPGLDGLTKQNPQWALKNVASLDSKVFLSTIAPQVIAGSYFKSSFDGVAINGQNPPTLAATQGRQATVPSQNVSTNATAPTNVVNQAPPVSTFKAPAVVDSSPATSTAPVQVLRPTTDTNSTESNSNSTSSATTFLRENSLKSLFAVALFSFSLS